MPVLPGPTQEMPPATRRFLAIDTRTLNWDLLLKSQNVPQEINLNHK